MLTLCVCVFHMFLAPTADSCEEVLISVLFTCTVKIYYIDEW